MLWVVCFVLGLMGTMLLGLGCTAFNEAVREMYAETDGSFVVIKEPETGDTVAVFDRNDDGFADIREDGNLDIVPGSRMKFKEAELADENIGGVLKWLGGLTGITGLGVAGRWWARKGPIQEGNRWIYGFIDLVNRVEVVLDKQDPDEKKRSLKVLREMRVSTEELVNESKDALKEVKLKASSLVE